MQPAVTRHAQARMQQRAIRADALEALLDFGCARHLNSRGREIVYFDKAARARFARTDPVAARKAERLWRTYAVLGNDGKVVTVGHRFRRITRT